MYTQGFGVAIAIAVLALVLPALYAAWWFVADLGGGRPGRPQPR